MRLNKQLQPLARRLRAVGLEIDVSGRHLKVRRNGRVVGVLPKTPSDHRSLKNAEAKLRRDGVL